jgi:hypothetical protein
MDLVQLTTVTANPVMPRLLQEMGARCRIRVQIKNLNGSSKTNQAYISHSLVYLVALETSSGSDSGNVLWISSSQLCVVRIKLVEANCSFQCPPVAFPVFQLACSSECPLAYI